jgi:hypothetical protein
MSLEFRRIETETDHETYFRFLIEHHDQLKLPYPYAVKLSFISSPLLYGGSMLIYSGHPRRVIGAAGCVYGTGPNDYEDRQICQVETVFLQKTYRRSRVFLQGLQYLLNMILADNPAVETVQFWTAADDLELQRLFSKLSSLPDSSHTISNSLMLYSISFQELRNYCQRLTRS